MAIIIPTAHSTYADATSTEGGALRKYVLAQFRSDANLAWVGDLRIAMVTQELKYKHFVSWRPRLRRNAELWKQVENGIGQATIIVTDPEPVAGAVRASFLRDGREEGTDFTTTHVLDECATALVAGTPIAYLPDELSKLVDWGATRRLASLHDFSPAAIRERIGQGLHHAKIFSARAHATFDVAALDENVTSTRDTFRSPLARIIMRELMSIERVFDKENPATTTLLNEASDEIADFMTSNVPTFGTVMPEPLAREVDSTTVDHLQAADLAAGWAREVLETSDERALARRFERVWLNGTWIKTPYQ